MIPGHHCYCTAADINHFALNIIDCNNVADANWTFQQNQKTAEKIIGKITQPQTDTESQHTSYECQCAQINAEYL